MKVSRSLSAAEILVISPALPRERDEQDLQGRTDLNSSSHLHRIISF